MSSCNSIEEALALTPLGSTSIFHRTCKSSVCIDVHVHYHAIIKFEWTILSPVHFLVTIRSGVCNCFIKEFERVTDRREALGWHASLHKTLCYKLLARANRVSIVPCISLNVLLKSDPWIYANGPMSDPSWFSWTYSQLHFLLQWLSRNVLFQLAGPCIALKTYARLPLPDPDLLPKNPATWSGKSTISNIIIHANVLKII